MTEAERLLREAALTIRNLICYIDGAEPRSEFSLITEIFDYLDAPTVQSETPRTDSVICPNCAHQFVAMPGEPNPFLESLPLTEAAEVLKHIRGWLKAGATISALDKAQDCLVVDAGKCDGNLRIDFEAAERRPSAEESK